MRLKGWKIAAEGNSPHFTFLGHKQHKASIKEKKKKVWSKLTSPHLNQKLGFFSQTALLYTIKRKNLIWGKRTD